MQLLQIPRFTHSRLFNESLSSLQLIAILLTSHSPVIGLQQNLRNVPQPHGLRKCKSESWNRINMAANTCTHVVDSTGEMKVIITADSCSESDSGRLVCQCAAAVARSHRHLIPFTWTIHMLGQEPSNMDASDHQWFAIIKVMTVYRFVSMVKACHS